MLADLFFRALVAAQPLVCPRLEGKLLLRMPLRLVKLPAKRLLLRGQLKALERRQGKPLLG
jgi:hypothetical protein